MAIILAYPWNSPLCFGIQRMDLMVCVPYDFVKSKTWITSNLKSIWRVSLLDWAWSVFCVSLTKRIQVFIYLAVCTYYQKYRKHPQGSHPLECLKGSCWALIASWRLMDKICLLLFVPVMTNFLATTKRNSMVPVTNRNRWERHKGEAHLAQKVLWSKILCRLPKSKKFYF